MEPGNSLPKMDMGGYGEFSTEKSGYGGIWIRPNGVEWSGPQNFAPWRALRMAHGAKRINSLSETNRRFDSCYSRKRLDSAAYVCYTSQNFCLIRLSNLSVLNFRFSCSCKRGHSRSPAGSRGVVIGGRPAQGHLAECRIHGITLQELSLLYSV